MRDAMCQPRPADSFRDGQGAYGSKPNKGRIKAQLGTGGIGLNAWALSGIGATRYEEVLS